MPAALQQEEEKIRYTYADYLEWDEGERYEILGGEAYMMASPSVFHQTISMKLSTQFQNFLEGKPCRVFAAPLDVRLFPREDNSDDTVVQPDILVVCDESKLADNRSCRGAPDLVIEILSPSNSDILLFLKFQNYLRAGVQEYWLVNPETREVQVHVLDRADGEVRYISTAHDAVEAINVTILPGLKIDFTGIWSAR
jgi:Uma2 family endonuclease